MFCKVVDKFAEDSVKKLSSQILFDVRQLVLDFFHTSAFRSKFLFELNTEDLRNELKNDVQKYLDLGWQNPNIDDIEVCSVEITGDSSDESIIIIKKSSSRHKEETTVEDMLEYIKKKIQLEPSWGGDGYRILNEDGGGEVYSDFDWEQLLFDVNRLERVVDEKDK